MSKVKVGDLFLQIAEKAGIPATDERLKEVAGIGIEVPEELATDLQSKLLTLEAALNNDSILDKAKRTYSQGFEQSLFETIESLGILPKDSLVEIKKTNAATGAKLKSSLQKIADQIQEIQKGTGKDSDEKLAEISKLHKEALAQVERLQGELAQKDEDFKSEKFKTVLQTKKQTLVEKIGWADHFDPSIRQSIFDIALDQKLSEIGAVLVVENNQLLLRKSSDKDQKVFDPQHREVTVESLVSTLVQEKGFAKAGAGNPKQNPGAPPLPPPGGDKPTKAQNINHKTLSGILGG